MVSEWEETTVGELVGRGILERPLDGNHGSIHPKGNDFVPSGVPFIMASDLIGGGIDTVNCSFITLEQAKLLRKGFAKTGDVLISHKATLGRTALIGEIPGEFVMLTPQVTYYRPKDPSKLNNRYLKYYFDSVGFQQVLQSWAGAGSTRAYIGITDQLRLPVLLPPLTTQRAIASVLGTLDDLIELNRETNEILEEMARALFKSWFVDFDPVRAKLEGRPPAGMDAATAALFPDHFQDSELGQIPKGWVNSTIGEICEINGWTLGKNDKLETLEYVEISEVNRGNIANMAIYHRGEEPSRARRRLRHGDTVLSTVRPDRGAYFLALNPPANRVASTGFAVITPSNAPWSFVHAAMTQPEISEHLGHLADGGAYPAVRPEIISGIEVVIPDTSAILDAFQKICAPLFEVAESNRLESRDLATLRDTLLPKLLSGEVSIPVSL